MMPDTLDPTHPKVMPIPEAGCWIWMGYLNPKGYGYVGWHTSVHRLSWRQHRGPLVRGDCVLHRCDTPPCLNPAHLFLGDRAANNRDMSTKGRQARGERCPYAKLTAAQVREIRTSTETQDALARRFGVHQSTISLAKRGINWSAPL